MILAAPLLGAGASQGRAKRDLVLLGVGDVAPNRAEFATMFEHVAPVFHQADIVFGNMEEVISDRGAPSVHAPLPMRTRPEAAKAIRAAGFHALSMANNHCMDWGHDGLVDTLRHVEEAGMAITGAGANIADARVPAIVERDGVKIAFVAASSILPLGYWADEQRPGCVPMRAYTHYEQIETDQPGTPARTLTFPHPADLQNLLADIRAARKKADIVVLSIHWGIHYVPEVIADYQRTIAHAAIDVGCDIVLGHHAHILKGVEVYKGKAIFYSLGNFAIELPGAWSKIRYEDRPRFKETRKLNPEIGKSRDSLFPDDMLKTGIVKCVVANKAIRRVSFLPCDLAKTAEPRPLRASDSRFAEVTDYLERISSNQELGTRFAREGDELVIQTT
jgi:poly-gamma-glutamate synthesis protein (capsule biosynthesis protein)